MNKRSRLLSNPLSLSALRYYLSKWAQLPKVSCAISKYCFPRIRRIPRFLLPLFGRCSAAFCLMFLSLILGAGCGTGKPASASFASVNIPGKTPEDICKTSAAVFQEDGYVVRMLTPASMVFEKEGTKGQSLAYGGVVDTYYGSTTVVRVRAQLVDIGAGSYRLQCKAYMVRKAGDSFFEDESPLTNIRSGPYQKLLNKVAKQLKS